MAIKILRALDSARVQYYHFKAIMIAGMGLFTDAYDFFCISPVMHMIGRIYYEPTFDPHTLESEPGVTPPEVLSATVAVALLGCATGQIIFGHLGDKMGRRRVYGMLLLMMVVGSFGCGFSFCHTRACVLSSLCFYRFLLGVGIGGDYPLSATIMSEFANRKTRGAFIAAVFSMQGFGILMSSAVTMAITTAFSRARGPSIDDKHRPPQEADLAWRIILMIGAIPAAITFYWRMTMPETARYTALVEQNVMKAMADMREVLDGVDLQLDEFEEDPMETPTPTPQRLKTYGLFSRDFLREHGRDLFACSASWFLLDVVFYCGNLFQSRIYKKFFEHKHADVYEEAFVRAKFQAIIASASTIPGYWAAVCLIDRVGRVRLQLVGFLFMGAFLFAVGGPYEHYWEDNTTVWFLVLYAVTFFFANLGPNTTTFIVPAELFPARLRSTCHGIAGAWGKLGAVFGAVGFLWASQSRRKEEMDAGYRPGIGMMASLLILAGVCVLGMVVTVFFMRETTGRSLEDNEAMEEEWEGVEIGERTNCEGVFDNSPAPPGEGERSRSAVVPVEGGNP